MYHFVMFFQIVFLITDNGVSFETSSSKKEFRALRKDELQAYNVVDHVVGMKNNCEII